MSRSESPASRRGSSSRSHGLLRSTPCTSNSRETGSRHWPFSATLPSSTVPAVDNANECVETFLANGRDLGLIRAYAGAERLLTFEIRLDEIDGARPPPD